MSRDPFDVLRDRLVEAARPRRRFRLVAPLAAVLVLSASAAAALTLTNHASAPVKTERYQVELMPDLTTGAIGWCGAVTIRGVAGGRGCGPAGPPGTHLIAGGGLFSTRGAGVAYAVVDRSVETVVMGGRRVTPRADPAVPSAWRVAVARVNAESIALLDADDRPLSSANRLAGRDPRGRAVDPNNPPDARCAIRAAKLAHLRAVSARLLTRIATRPVIAPAYLSCATTVYYLGKWRVRAAVLLNAADPDAEAPPLPPSRFIDSRRAGSGWLVVFGADKAARERLLAALSTRG